MNSAAGLHRLLGDEARLRLLRLVAKQRLNVTELTSVLGIAQSGVSRHLGLLKDAGLVAESREGGFTYYGVAPEVQLQEVRLEPDATATKTVRLKPDTTETSAPAAVVSGFSRTNAGTRRPIWALLEAQFAAAAHDRAIKADDARLHEVLRLRKENFETHGGARGQLVPGRSWAAWARALGHLLPPVRVADLGCGEGYLTIEAAQWASQVVAIDRSAAVLRQAKALARRRGVANVTWKRGEIERLPLGDASVDVALLSQALHHAADPARALAEAARIVAPGGTVLVLDLSGHDQAWVRDRLGDRWLGFDETTLRALLAGAGLANVKISVGARLKGDPFTVLIGSGRRAGTGDSGLGTRDEKNTERTEQP
jgi:SAM-dependent methyltransferase